VTKKANATKSTHGQNQTAVFDESSDDEGTAKHFLCISYEGPKSLHLLFVLKHKHTSPRYSKGPFKIQQAIISIPYRKDCC